LCLVSLPLPQPSFFLRRALSKILVISDCFDPEVCGSFGGFCLFRGFFPFSCQPFFSRFLNVVLNVVRLVFFLPLFGSVSPSLLSLSCVPFPPRFLPRHCRRVLVILFFGNFSVHPGGLCPLLDVAAPFQAPRLSRLQRTSRSRLCCSWFLPWFRIRFLVGFFT